MKFISFSVIYYMKEPDFVNLQAILVTSIKKILYSCDRYTIVITDDGSSLLVQGSFSETVERINKYLET